MKYLTPILFLIAGVGCQANNDVLSSKSNKNLEPTIVSEPSLDAGVQNNVCPSNMVEAVGLYCTKVKQECSKWREDPKTNKFARCDEYNKSICIGDKVQMHFCIDKEEFATNFEGLPISDVSWTQAKSLCEANGERLCSNEEWTFACEGEDMLPYPTGYKRPTGICNIDIESNLACGKLLCDYRKDISENPECLSPFGVHNMVGNADEWAEVPTYHHSKMTSMTMRSVLKGGWWGPLRNRCRPMTTDHDELFHELQTGVRCCKDIK